MSKLKQKLNNTLRRFTKLKDLIIGGGYDFAYPQSIQIEPTIACNLKCIICNDEIKKRLPADKAMMSFDNFKKIINQFPYIKSVNLTGYGEPMMNKDIYKMIAYAKTRQLQVHFATNATLLNQENAQKIIKSQLDALVFSIDSGVEERYNTIRQGASFQQVIENIKNFMKLVKAQQHKIRTKVYAVPIFSEMKYIKHLIDLTADLQIAKLDLRAIFDHTGKNTAYDENALYHAQNVIAAEKYLQEAEDYAQQKNIKLYYSPLRPVRNYICRMPYVRPYVTVEGYVTPCCLQGVDPRNINFGNILQKRYKQIRNNKKIRSFRKKLLSPDPPFVCKYCPRLKGMA